jgi:SAM-dependent methyltransferase
MNITMPEIIAAATDPVTKRCLAEIWSAMPPSVALTPSVEQMANACLKKETWADIHTCVFACARHASRYLEIGVRRGHSIIPAMVSNPMLSATAVDVWSGDYSKEPNTVKMFEDTLDYLGIGFVAIFQGDSKVILPQFEVEGNRFDLITVDGDHESEPAATDLRNAEKLLKPGGVLIFDDINHPSYPGLLEVWKLFKAAFPTWEFHEFDYGTGTGIGIKH